jgi:uncharacterized protein
MKQPYHEGELFLQKAQGQTGIAQIHGALISDVIVKGAWKFIEYQTMVVMVAWDGITNVFPSFLIGKPGFAKTIDGSQIIINLDDCNGVEPSLEECYKSTDFVSFLFIDFTSRRRLRVNGKIILNSEDTGINQLFIKVLESYPNCPKYIQRRKLTWEADKPIEIIDDSTGNLTSEAMEIVNHADTFFVGTIHPLKGLDASHRGGKPGFINLISKSELKIPDYVGNSMFNTLGNIFNNGLVGLLIPNFEKNKLLRVMGKASIVINNQSDVIQGFWHVKIERVQLLTMPRMSSNTYIDASPYNP